MEPNERMTVCNWLTTTMAMLLPLAVLTNDAQVVLPTCDRFLLASQSRFEIGSSINLCLTAVISQSITDKSSFVGKES